MTTLELLRAGGFSTSETSFIINHDKYNFPDIGVGEFLGKTYFWTRYDKDKFTAAKFDGLETSSECLAAIVSGFIGIYEKKFPGADLPGTVQFITVN